MTKVSFNAFSEILLKKSKKTYPIYCFAGEEAYFLDSCLNKLEKAFSFDALNREIFYAKDAPIEDILSIARTIPFFNSKREIIIKEVDKMPAQSAVQLSQYILNPDNSSCLILSYLGNPNKDTTDKRKALINLCSKNDNCLFVDCQKMKEYGAELKNFIKQEFKDRNKNISESAISMIIEENGVDLLNIVNEIEKASLFIGKDKNSVSVGDIEMTSGYTKEANIFHLANYIEAKNSIRALTVLENLLSEGEAAIKILACIAASIRKLLSAKSMIEEKGMSEREVLAGMRYNFFADKFIANLKKHSLKKLQASLKALLKTDIALKTSLDDNKSALQKLILFITK